MSLFARPSVTLAIVFGCFVVLIPRILLPYFRPRPAHRTDDHLRRTSSSSTPPSPLSMNHHQENMIEPMMDSSSEFVQADELISKSNTTFVLPMYAVGIAVFLIYTFFKYFRNCKNQEEKIRSRYCPTDIHWNAQKKKFNYQINSQQTFDNVNVEQHDEDSYAGLDADYVEYLKQRRRQEQEREQALTIEQRQMHNTLDEMKHSLSFITSKLGTNTKNMSLTNNEIAQLQNRLAQTEAQMYKILNALDVASNKMNEITRNTQQSLDQPSRTFDYDEDYHQSSRSLSESEDDEEDDDDEHSSHDEKQISYDNKKCDNEKQDVDDESESSYEDDEEEAALNEYDDDESESSTDRYGLMTSNYGCNASTVDDYDLDEMTKPDETTDSQTKVHQWQQRHHSQSLSSNHSSTDDDNNQTISNLQQQENELEQQQQQENQLRRRKHQHEQ